MSRGSVDTISPKMTTAISWLSNGDIIPPPNKNMLFIINNSYAHFFLTDCSGLMKLNRGKEMELNMSENMS